MVTLTELQHTVDTAFASTSRGLAPWPDPHPHRSPLEEEYSRVLDPGKWRIVPARADAWADATIGLGLATLERDASTRWAENPGRSFVRVDALVPHTPSAVPLTLAYSVFVEGVDVNGVTIGAGDPAVVAATVPPCGCDACDSGSQDALDLVDEHVLAVITGSFRHLTHGSRTIMALGRERWSASGHFGDDEIEATPADPAGWHEISGPSWLGAR